jgi:acetylglutamate kinase
MTQVIKISGAQLDDPEFLGRLATALAAMQQPTVIVHGGGKEISELQKRFGVTPQYIDGLRVTDEESLVLVKMALLGAVNPRIIEALAAVNIEAQGLSGLDRALVTAKPMRDGALGRVGEVVTVRDDILRDLLAQNVMPVIAPICLGSDGAYNVNADHVAGAVGKALNAERIVFITNVPGVLQNEAVLPTLTPQKTKALIDEGVITEGMIPKVQTALDLLERSSGQVVITNWEGLAAGSGTTFTKEGELA